MEQSYLQQHQQQSRQLLLPSEEDSQRDRIGLAIAPAAGPEMDDADSFEDVSTGTVEQPLRDFLARLNLEHYVDVFYQLGAVDVSHLAEMDDLDLAGLQLKPLERRRLLSAIQTPAFREQAALAAMHAKENAAMQNLMPSLQQFLVEMHLERHAAIFHELGAVEYAHLVEMRARSETAGAQAARCGAERGARASSTSSAAAGEEERSQAEHISAAAETAAAARRRGLDSDEPGSREGAEPGVHGQADAAVRAAGPAAPPSAPRAA
eukprot:SAG22_NODE_3509_length_1672_cov_1.306421_2_plen_265_part_00